MGIPLLFMGTTPVFISDDELKIIVHSHEMFLVWQVSVTIGLRQLVYTLLYKFVETKYRA